MDLNGDLEVTYAMGPQRTSMRTRTIFLWHRYFLFDFSVQKDLQKPEQFPQDKVRFVQCSTLAEREREVLNLPVLPSPAKETLILKKGKVWTATEESYRISVLQRACITGLRYLSPA